MEVQENKSTSHPLILGDIVICQLAHSIMTTKIDEPSPLQDLDNNSIIAIGQMIGLEVKPKELEARCRKKDAKFYDVENSIVLYVQQNCSCFNDM